jgi:dynein heavy chain 2
MVIINKLPENDSPQVFGLPMNIDKAVQRYNTGQMITSLKILQQVSAEELKFEKEKWSLILGPIINFWQSIYK